MLKREVGSNPINELEAHRVASADNEIIAQNANTRKTIRLKTL